MLRPTSVLAYAKPPSPQGEGFGLCEPLAPTAPHPAGIMIPTTFPQGKASLKRVGTLLQPPTVHPLRHLRCHLPLHAVRLTPRRFCVWNPSGRGMPPLHAKTILHPAPTPAPLFPFLSSLIKIMPLPELSSGERSCLYFVPKMRSPASPRPGMM